MDPNSDRHEKAKSIEAENLPHGLNMLPAAYAWGGRRGIMQLGNPLPMVLSAAWNDLANMTNRVGNLIQSDPMRQLIGPFREDPRVEVLIQDIWMMLNEIHEEYPSL
jgi:hypothetical protein